MNIGEPIALAPLLDEHQPDWRDKLGQDGRVAGVGPAVDALAQTIMRHIHAAAAVTPVNLLATVMLATPRQVMPREGDLARQLAMYLQLLRDAPYSRRMTVTALDPPRSGTALGHRGRDLRADFVGGARDQAIEGC